MGVRFFPSPSVCIEISLGCFIHFYLVVDYGKSSFDFLIDDFPFIDLDTSFIFLDKQVKDLGFEIQLF